jgi:hypothetical protein
MVEVLRYHALRDLHHLEDHLNHHHQQIGGIIRAKKIGNFE